MEENKLSRNRARNNSSDGEKELSVPVIKEVVTVDKDVVETGKVKIKKNVSYTDKDVKIALQKADVEVKTVMINKLVDEAPEAVRYEGDTMIISELQEVCVVRLMLVKEIHVTTKKSTSHETQKVTLRKEEVVIEKTRTKQ
jgi:stress response protein YsnF